MSTETVYIDFYGWSCGKHSSDVEKCENQGKGRNVSLFLDIFCAKFDFKLMGYLNVMPCASQMSVTQW